MTPDQQRLADRLQLTPEQIAIAANTTGVKDLLKRAVEFHGESVVYGRGPGGKGVMTFGGEWKRLFVAQKASKGRKTSTPSA